MDRILVIGSLNMDYTVRSERMPLLGETLNGNDFSISAGGKGANQAAAAAKLGSQVRMLGAVGNDVSGDALLCALEQCGVDCSFVMKTDCPTGAAMIVVVNGDNFILIDHGANYAVTPKQLQKEDWAALFRWADIVVLQLEIPLETVRAAAKAAKEAGVLVVLNPAPINPALDGDVLQYVDLLVPNEHEAASLLGYEIRDEAVAEKAAGELYERWGCRVIITLGERGSVYFDGTEAVRQKAVPAQVTDTTAAGDSFIGGLCAAMAGGQSMQEALSFAAAVASCTIEKRGAIPSLPDRKQADNRAAAYADP